MQEPECCMQEKLQITTFVMLHNVLSQSLIFKDP